MSLLMVRKSAPAKAADKTEKIAQDSEIVALWQVLGDAKAYLREGKKNHNVKNVLAAAIKAAEKENPNDRSVLEAKKVLAQFDAQDANGDEVIAQKNGCKLVHNTLNDGYWFYTKSGAGWGITATNKFDAVNEFNRLVDPAKDAAEGYAQDSGNYTTNIEALLKTAYSALNKAESVVRVVLRNISNAFDKVQDAQAKSSLNNLEKDWSACEREVWAALEKVERIYVPSGVGVPNKKKLSPEDRKFIEAFFG